MDTYITAGVVVFATLLGFAGFCWFLWMDERRMEREEREAQEIEAPKNVVMFRRSA